MTVRMRVALVIWVVLMATSVMWGFPFYPSGGHAPGWFGD
jgi:hypothetical protein